MPVLLCAEADKIQDIVFRSSALRMVVGASELLTRFCRQAHPALVAQLGLAGQATTLVNDGGSFVVALPDADAARRYGRLLAEAYHATIGGTLTVAEPTPYRGPAHFAEDVELAREALAVAKAAGHPRSAVAQSPFTAYCQWCGIELASVHRRLQPKLDERETYICPTCQRKDAEREVGKTILQELREATGQELKGVGDLDLPYPISAEDLAGWDPRGLGYVAYLLADGNGMGQLFSACDTADKLQELSKTVPELLTLALGKVAAALVAHPNAPKDGRMPLLPMILGGDDLLALIPAPFAWDAAVRFCRYYEALLGQRVKDLDIQAPAPTVSAVVVICKSDYPYRHAHEEAEESLKAVKGAVRRSERAGYRSSALGFVALKGQAREAEAPAGKYLSSAMPYWINDQGLPDGFLLARKLLDQRLALKDVPTNQLAAVEALFYPPSGPPADGRDEPRWRALLSARLQRIGSQALTDAARELGWHGRDDVHTWHSHGLPDLLSLWNYAYDLDQELATYAPKEA